MVLTRILSGFLFACVYLFTKFSLFSVNYLYLNTSLLFLVKVFILSGFLLSIYLVFIASTRLTLLFGVVVCIFFPVMLLIYIYLGNLIVFLLCYEVFIFPSVVMLFFFSPNTRFLAANLYFLLWTQFGSFLVVLACIYIYSVLNINTSIYKLPGFPALLLLLGFGVKVPIWPFHFWLTKTHVEAPTFFSIYLSGFLVKTAIFGILLFTPYISTPLIKLALVVSSIGVIDATLKLIVQVDLKKFVAYTTIQEMNLILLIVFYTQALNLVLISAFILTHTLLSTLFFYLVDVLYKKYRGRTTNLVYGLWSLDNLLGFVVYFSILLYLGLPYTTKFFIELNLFLTLWSVDPLLCVVLLVIVNLFGAIFFGKVWLNVLFGFKDNKSLIKLKRKQYLFFLLYFSLFALFLPLSILL